MARKVTDSTLEKQINEHDDAIEKLRQEKDNLLSVERQERLQELEAKKDGYLSALKTARVTYKMTEDKQDKSFKAHQKKVAVTKEANRKLQIAQLNLRQVEHAINNA